MLRNHSLRGLWLGLGVVALLASAGCATDTPGVTNTAGRYDTVVNAPPPRATRAATDVLEDGYKFKLISSALSAIDGKVEAQSAQGMTVWVWVERRGDNDSLVSVRAGSMGDEKLSLEILGKIKEQSKTVMQKLHDKM